MGWKTQTILIRPAVLEGGMEPLLGDLGYDKVRKVSDTPFNRALEGSIWIGVVDDCVIIYSPLAGLFFAAEGDEEHQEFEVFRDALLRRFSTADIAVLSLHSVVGHWGFAVFRQGELIRRQHGYDGMVMADDGTRLPVEEAYLSKFDRHKVDGLVRYRDPRHPEWGDMGDPDFGQELVFEICKSFAGARLDRLQANGTNFWLNDDEEEFLRANAKHSDGMLASRPWWRFWS